MGSMPDVVSQVGMSVDPALILDPRLEVVQLSVLRAQLDATVQYGILGSSCV